MRSQTKPLQLALPIAILLIISQKCRCNNTCSKGSYRNSNDTCTRCSDNCKECDEGGCKICKIGFLGQTTPLSGPGYVECQACIEGCDKCETLTICTSCGSFFDKKEDGKVCELNKVRAYTTMVLVLGFCVLFCLICCIGMFCVYKKQWADRRRMKSVPMLTGKEGLNPAPVRVATMRHMMSTPYTSFTSTNRGLSPIRPQMMRAYPQPVSGRIYQQPKPQINQLSFNQNPIQFKNRIHPRVITSNEVGVRSHN